MFLRQPIERWKLAATFVGFTDLCLALHKAAKLLMQDCWPAGLKAVAVMQAVIKGYTDSITL
jgi:hypothetical protein